MTPKVALLTGASEGLGRVLAHFLAGQGYALVVDARREGALRREAQALEGLGAVVRAIPGSVADPDHRRQLVREAGRIGELKLLVNNASTLGPTPMPDLEHLPLDSLREVLEVNLVAPIALIQESLPLLAAAKGLVVNISSDAAVGGYPGWGGYGLTKAALDLATLTLAHELKARGVGFLSVDPGDMRTAMHQAGFPGKDISDRPLPEVTLPFWAWLLGQDPAELSGQRFRAQAESWGVADAD